MTGRAERLSASGRAKHATRRRTCARVETAGWPRRARTAKTASRPRGASIGLPTARPATDRTSARPRLSALPASARSSIPRPADSAACVVHRRDAASDPAQLRAHRQGGGSIVASVDASSPPYVPSGGRRRASARDPSCAARWHVDRPTRPAVRSERRRFPTRVDVSSRALVSGSWCPWTGASIRLEITPKTGSVAQRERRSDRPRWRALSRYRRRCAGAKEARRAVRVGSCSSASHRPPHAERRSLRPGTPSWPKETPTWPTGTSTMASTGMRMPRSVHAGQLRRLSLRRSSS